MHLRTLLLLKCVSFALGALQLRSGYPPPASFSNGMGRHTFWFMRHVSTPHAVAFQAFMVTGGCVCIMWQACCAGLWSWVGQPALTVHESDTT